MNKKIRDQIKKLNAINYKIITIKEIEKLLDPLFVGYMVNAPKYYAGTRIFRGRICSKPAMVSELKYPPKEVVLNYGRANDIGQSMFYGTIGREIPFFELDPKEGDTIAISLWKTTADLMLNHVGYTAKTAEALKSKRDFVNMYDFIKQMAQTGNRIISAYDYLASAFTRKVNKNKAYYYKLSIAITNKLLGTPLSGIMYPTISYSGDADNIVLIPEFVDKHLELVSVEFVKISMGEDGKLVGNILDTASSFTKEGTIQWSGKLLGFSIPKDGKFTVEPSGDHWVGHDSTGNIIDTSSVISFPKKFYGVEKMYVSNFPATIKLGMEFNVSKENFLCKVHGTLHIDFRNEIRFLSYHIPDNINAEEIVAGTIRNKEILLFLDKENSLKTGELDKKTKKVLIESDQLEFSGDIYFYLENKFDTARLESIFTPPIKLHFIYS